MKMGAAELIVDENGGCEATGSLLPFVWGRGRPPKTLKIPASQKVHFFSWGILKRNFLILMNILNDILAHWSDNFQLQTSFLLRL